MNGANTLAESVWRVYGAPLVLPFVVGCITALVIGLAVGVVIAWKRR